LVARARAKLVGAGGKVIAIEPDPDNFKALLVGVKMNNLSNVIALNVAAYERECRLPLYIAPRSGRTSKGYLIGKGWSSLKRPIGRRIEVEARTLDKIVEELGFNDIKYIKIDAEGSEFEVLIGAKNILKTNRPKIICEVTTNKVAILKLLKSMRYRATLIAPNLFFFKPD
jgi:FkbM family methyltransferase